MVNAVIIINSLARVMVTVIICVGDGARVRVMLGLRSWLGIRITLTLY